MKIREFIESENLEQAIISNSHKFRDKFRKIVDKTNVGELDIEDQNAIRKIEKTVSWNWYAFFFNSFWAIYRKEKLGWITLVIGMLLGPLALIFPIIDKITTPYPYILMIIFGMYGNSYVLRNALKIFPQTTSAVDRAQISKNGLLIAITLTILYIIFAFFLVFLDLI